MMNHCGKKSTSTTRQVSSFIWSHIFLTFQSHIMVTYQLLHSFFQCVFVSMRIKIQCHKNENLSFKQVIHYYEVIKFIMIFFSHPMSYVSHQSMGNSQTWNLQYYVIVFCVVYFLLRQSISYWLIKKISRFKMVLRS